IRIAPSRDSSSADCSSNTSGPAAGEAIASIAMIRIIPAEWGGCRLWRQFEPDLAGGAERQVFAAQLDRLSGLMTSFGQQGWALLLLAPFIGSFLGVLTRRLPEGRPIARGRSHCESCGATLTPRDLVPLVSWLAAR